MNHPDASTEAPRPAPRSLNREARLWLVSLALTLPSLLPLASHFAAPPAGRQPTGFIAYDMPYYMANAREHFDAGRFRFFYSNPFDPRDEAPAIYVQPMTLALGSIAHATGADPGLLFAGFGILAAWACARVALALYAEVVGLGDGARRLGLVAFFWGGGLLAVAGIVRMAVVDDPGDERGLFEQIFHFDPQNGWWMLNFGRNLVYPTEALYHALFFGCVLCLLRGRFVASAILAFLVSISHPFTGVELLLILVAWAALELSFVRSEAAPRRYFAAVLGLLGAHLGYYLVYLGRFPEHRSLMEKWSLAWELKAENFLPAYALVGGLAYWSFRRLDLARSFFASPRNRLFLAWFVVAFTLANHEFAIRPIQPLHFTRGYIWTPLFFLGAVPLVALLAGSLALRGPARGMAAVGLILATLLLDNAIWLGQFPLKAMTGRFLPDGYAVSADRRELFRWLGRDENRGALLLTDDPELGYLVSVYTPLRSWIGHEFNTPDYDRRADELDALFAHGRLADDWRGKRLLIVSDRDPADPPRPPVDRARPVHENGEFVVYRLDPS